MFTPSHVSYALYAFIFLKHSSGIPCLFVFIFSFSGAKFLRMLFPIILLREWHVSCLNSTYFSFYLCDATIKYTCSHQVDRIAREDDLAKIESVKRAAKVSFEL